MALTKVTYSMIADNVVNAIDFIPANVNPATTDCQPYFTAALAAGSSVYIPEGTFRLDTTLVVPNAKILFGENRAVSTLLYYGLGNAIEVGNNPVNGSGYGLSQLKNFQVSCANASNTGAGIALNSGGFSYYEVDLMYSTGFLYGIVVDQSEVSHIHRSIFETRERVIGTPMWITNGPEWRAGGLKRFTNGITVQDCQFNQGKYAIIDDGGNDHTFIGNNLNGSRLGGMHLAGVTGLLITGSAWETGNAEAGTNNLFFNIASAYGSALKGVCKGAQITGNTFAPMAATDSAMISFPSGNLPLYHSGFNITANYFVEGLGGAPAAIDVTALSGSFCGFNDDHGPLGDPRPHYMGIHNDANGNVLYPPSGANTSDSNVAYAYGNTVNATTFSGGFGYNTGAGGTVTQATSKTTTVVLNKMCGKITMNNASLAAGAIAIFGLNNTFIQNTDLLLVNAIQIVATYDVSNYQIWAAPNSGGNSASIYVKNISSGALTDALQINFGIVKSVTT